MRCIINRFPCIYEIILQCITFFNACLVIFQSLFKYTIKFNSINVYTDYVIRFRNILQLVWTHFYKEGKFKESIVYLYDLWHEEMGVTIPYSIPQNKRYFYSILREIRFYKLFYIFICVITTILRFCCSTIKC